MSDQEPYCIGCGCTEHAPCDGIFGEGCYWLVYDREARLGVCSECEDHLDAFRSQYTNHLSVDIPALLSRQAG